MKYFFKFLGGRDRAKVGIISAPKDNSRLGLACISCAIVSCHSARLSFKFYKRLHKSIVFIAIPEISAKLYQEIFS